MILFTILSAAEVVCQQPQQTPVREPIRREGAAMLLLAELSGWLGMFLVLAGYACFSLGWIAGGRIFHGCNLIGSTALVVNGYHHGAWPFVALNLAWAVISTIALVRAWRAGRVGMPPRNPWTRHHR